MDKKIRLVHFQLTKNCNLRCWFCGQWGKKGFFSDAVGNAMSLKDWKSVISQLKEYGIKNDNLPEIMLWGGEPLIYPDFDEIVRILRKEGFKLGIVTNGVMINKFCKTLKNEFKHIYVSVDGVKEVHDKIRGNGVFDTICDNLKMLEGTSAKITVMSVISDDNILNLDQTVSELLKLNCDEIILQDMIALSKDEAVKYKQEMKKIGIDAEYIDSWIMENPPRVDLKISEEICKKYNGKVKHLPHGKGKICESAFSHIHIAWNGNVLYCTDFYDFSAGNVKQEKIIDIFNNEKSEKFRDMIKNEKCPTCQHCSWWHNKTFEV